MSLKDGFMENGLSTERGSAGIDMILWSFLVLVFLAMPLLMSVFEVYSYVMEGSVWSAAAENVLDQVEWQLQTEALSECERTLLLDHTQEVFKNHFDEMAREQKGVSWAIKSLTYTEGEVPRLEVNLQVRYEPFTMIGAFISQGGQLELQLSRQREFPIDR